MKKYLILISLLIMSGSFVLTSCNDSVERRDDNTSDNSDRQESVEDSELSEESEEDKEIYLKEAYIELCDAFEIMCSLGDSVQGAWYFGIYGDEASYDALALDCGVYSDDLSKASDDLFGYSIEIIVDDFQYSVPLVIAALEDDYNRAEECLNIAEDSIRNATDDLNNYEDMKNFYTSSLSYLEWLSSPSGNFEQATDTMNEYENELNEFKNDLSFDYGN